MLWSMETLSSVTSTLLQLKVRCTFTAFLVLLFSMSLRSYPMILTGDESFGAVVLHAGVNDIRLRQTEVLKQDFRSLIETVHSALPVTKIIVSGQFRGSSMLMACTPAEPEQIFCQTTSSRCYTPYDHRPLFQSLILQRSSNHSCPKRSLAATDQSTWTLIIRSLQEFHQVQYQIFSISGKLIKP